MKRAIDYKGPRATSVLVLLRNGKYVGRVVANHSGNPNGSVCTADVGAWGGALSAEEGVATGRAGGYGYCKFSAAVSDALCRMKCLTPEQREAAAKVHGAGRSAVRSFFESLGYDVLEVL